MSLENEFCVPFRKKVIYRDPEYDMAEQEQAKIQAALEMSRKMREAAANPTPGPMPTQPMAPAAGELKIPNFCPKCGRPSGGYRFCGGCGNRLA
ncbi:MAG: hypothetical protein IK055_08745 [Lachnospiraceae bacterium]|nr:hypothetical protein [Lachnospiraceae bacterium]